MFCGSSTYKLSHHTPTGFSPWDFWDNFGIPSLCSALALPHEACRISTRPHGLFLGDLGTVFCMGFVGEKKPTENHEENISSWILGG